MLLLLSFHYFSCFVLTVVPLLQHLTLTTNRWNQLDSHNILFNVSSIILSYFKKFICISILTEERQRDRHQKENPFKHFWLLVSDRSLIWTFQLDTPDKEHLIAFHADGSNPNGAHLLYNAFKKIKKRVELNQPVHGTYI